MLSPQTKYDNRTQPNVNGKLQQSFRNLYHAETYRYEECVGGTDQAKNTVMHKILIGF